MSGLRWLLVLFAKNVKYPAAPASMHPYRTPGVPASAREYVCPCGTKDCEYEPLHAQEAASQNVD